MNAAVLSIAAAVMLPVPLERLGAEQARAMAGQVRTFTFVVATPPWTFRGSTVVGAAAGLDGAERSAVLRGVNYDADVGRRVNVTGRMLVIEHAADPAIGEAAWVEIRVEGVAK